MGAIFDRGQGLLWSENFRDEEWGLNVRWSELPSTFTFLPESPTFDFILFIFSVFPQLSQDLFC